MAEEASLNYRLYQQKSPKAKRAKTGKHTIEYPRTVEQQKNCDLHTMEIPGEERKKQNIQNNND